MGARLLFFIDKGVNFSMWTFFKPTVIFEHPAFSRRHTFPRRGPIKQEGLAPLADCSLYRLEPL